VLAHPFVTPDEFDRHAARSILRTLRFTATP